VASGISKRIYRQTSQDVCPWNVRFAESLPEDSPYQPREVLREKDARTLARELLAMSQEEFSAAFRKSPMKRAKLRGPRATPAS
jgi:epoxyqueuosine reductase